MSAPAAGSGGDATQPSGLTLDGKQTLIPDPSWPCSMPQGIPGPLTGEPAFDIDFTVGDVHDIGQTQYGHRVQIDVSGGKVDGPKLQGTLLDRGLDYELTLDNGVVEDEQIHILMVGGSAVYMRNCGVSPGPGVDVRVVLDFEAPNTGTASFLNTGKFIGTREWDAQHKTLRMKVYQVGDTVDSQDAVSVPKLDDGTPRQTWECKKASGSQGNIVYMESVGIAAGSVTVGASKRGTRNIIPITGGTTTGRITGTVLSGGADYQLIDGANFILDARYTINTDDGELIIVRNCGPVGALVPVFETRADGKYAWVNANTWLSSDPGIGANVVNLTIYEQR